MSGVFANANNLTEMNHIPSESADHGGCFFVPFILMCCRFPQRFTRLKYLPEKQTYGSSLLIYEKSYIYMAFSNLQSVILPKTYTSVQNGPATNSMQQHFTNPTPSPLPLYQTKQQVCQPPMPAGPHYTELLTTALHSFTGCP